MSHFSNPVGGHPLSEYEIRPDRPIWAGGLFEPGLRPTTGEAVRLRICREPNGEWSVTVPADRSTFVADSLSEAFEYAKQACAAVPAVIELFGTEGYVLSVVQDQGWPLPIGAPRDRRHQPLSAKFAELVRRLSRLFRDWRPGRRAFPQTAVVIAAPVPIAARESVRPAADADQDTGWVPDLNVKFMRAGPTRSRIFMPNRRFSPATAAVMRGNRVTAGSGDQNPTDAAGPTAAPPRR